MRLELQNVELVGDWQKEPVEIKLTFVDLQSKGVHTIEVHKSHLKELREVLNRLEVNDHE